MSEICNPTLRAVCINSNQSGDHLRPRVENSLYMHSVLCTYTHTHMRPLSVRTYKSWSERRFHTAQLPLSGMLVKRVYVMKGESCSRAIQMTRAQHPAANKLFPECFQLLPTYISRLIHGCAAPHFNAQNYSARVVTGNRFSSKRAFTSGIAKSEKAPKADGLALHKQVIVASIQK